MAARQCEADGKRDEASRGSSEQPRRSRIRPSSIGERPSAFSPGMPMLIATSAMRMPPGASKARRKCFLTAIEVIPRCTAAHVNLGFLLLNQGKDVEAEKQFREALAYEPDNFGACRGIAACYIRREKLDEAAQYYQKVLRLLPNDPSALNDLGVVRLRQGKADEAAAMFQELLRAAPDSPDVRTNSRRSVVRPRAPGEKGLPNGARSSGSSPIPPARCKCWRGRWQPTRTLPSGTGPKPSCWPSGWSS